MAEWGEMTLAGHPAELHGGKFLFLPTLGILCAADLHFEKSSFFGRFATFLPPYDTEETLVRLEAGIAHFRPRLFLALGDSFHDARAGERLRPEHHARLVALVAAVPEWIWITGNHDPDIAPTLPGRREEDWRAHGICFRHEAEMKDDLPEVSGHYHPKTSVSIGPRRISAPCFLASGSRLILPSFGSFTGGLDVNHPELLRKMPPAARRLFLVHQERTYEIRNVQRA